MMIKGLLSRLAKMSIVAVFFAPMILSAQTIDSVCFNGIPDSLTSTAPATGGDGAFTYEWQDSVSGGSWASIAASNSLDFQPSSLTQSTYFRRKVTSTSCGTAYSNPVQIHVFDVFDTISTSVTNVTCNGASTGAISLTITGGNTPYIYSWSNGGSASSATGLTAGAYTVTVTDAAGCGTLNYSFTISEPTALVASIGSTINVVCNGGNTGSAIAAATGGTGAYTYAWSNGASSASITGLIAGTYTVTVTDANGCTDTELTTISEPAALVASIASSTNVLCNGGSNGAATATASGGTGAYTYAWSNGASSATATGLLAGTYTVTVTDANGCTDTDAVIISEPTALVANVASSNNASCNGSNDGSATASGAGGTAPYSFLWSNGAGTAGATGLLAGSYTVTVTDANGCTDTDVVTITEPAILVASISGNVNVSCNGGANGSLTASATGGTTAYTYLWSDGSTAATAAGLSAGTYTVTITDANGCSDTESATVTEPTLLVLSTSAVNVTCNGGLDGAIDLTVSGGTTSYTFSWSNGAVTEDINSISAGTYTVTVTDANGCSDNTSETLSEPAVLTGGSIIIGN